MGTPRTLIVGLATILIICSFGTWVCSQALLEGASLTPPIKTPSGTFVGYTVNHTSHFLGIRYARAGRFEAPIMEHYDPSTIVHVMEYPPLCWQRSAQKDYYPHDGMSEDCLALNIYAPQSKIEEIASNKQNITLLPVVVWVHGGAFTLGSGANRVVSGFRLTSHDVILVTINYRLGLFGFWRHEKFRAHSKNSQGEQKNYVTNAGLLDQRVSLEWIQKNIASFGGDPNSVTLFGESAGATSILHHITSTRAVNDAKNNRSPLFHRVWLISPVLLDHMYFDRDDAEEIGNDWALQKGCPDGEVLECMLAMSAEELSDNYVARWSAFDHDTNRYSIYPTVDAEFPHIHQAMRNGAFDRNVKIIVGTSMQDASLFTWFAFPLYGPDREYLEIMIERSFGSVSRRIFELYPSHGYEHEFWRFNDILSDAVWHCTSQMISSYFSKWSYHPARRYVFNLRFNDSADIFGIYHASELTMLFKNPSGTYLFPKFFTAEESILADKMSDFLIHFAKDLITNEEWPKFSPKSAQILLFGNGSNTNITIESHFRKVNCDFWIDALPHGLTTLPRGLDQFEGYVSTALNSLFWSLHNVSRNVSSHDLVVGVSSSIATLVAVWALRKLMSPMAITKM